VTLPANLAVGDVPNLTNAGKPVPIKSGQGDEKVLNYNRPAEMPGFITVFPDDREVAKFDYYSNLGQLLRLLIRHQKPNSGSGFIILRVITWKPEPDHSVHTEEPAWCNESKQFR